MNDREELEALRRMAELEARAGSSPKYASESDNPSNVGIFNALESLNKGIYNAGGNVTDLASKVGASPEVAGGLGYLSNVGLQAASGGVGMGSGKLAAPLMQQGSEKLMYSVLKPALKAHEQGDAALAVKTLLDNGINATLGGVHTLKDKIGGLNDQVKNLIANSTETVSKYDVGSKLQSVYDKFRNQVNPQPDLEAIKNSLKSFNDHPLLANKTDIPVQLAQDLKIGTYKQLSGKYGELGSADTEAQKGLASGLRETIAQKVPEVAPLLSRERDLIRTLNVTERRALMQLNNNPNGLALLANNPGAYVAFLADKSATFKSLLAHLMYKGKDVIPGTAGALGGAAAGGALGQAPQGALSESY